MKIDDLRKRLQKDRHMTMISMRMPEDVIVYLKRIAPLLGFSGYQFLMRAYIGQGLRVDLEKLESSVEVSLLIESLRNQGVEEEAISLAIAEVQGGYE